MPTAMSVRTCSNYLRFFLIRAGKIPKSMLSAYQSACEKITIEQIEGLRLINTLFCLQQVFSEGGGGGRRAEPLICK